MFVRSAVHIDSPFEAVAPCFLRDPSWLEPLLPSGPGHPPARCVRGTARRRADSLVVPIRWAMADADVFPSLDGDLAIVPAGARSTSVTFEATYALVLDDEALGTEHVVQAAVEAFLDGLAAALRAEGPVFTTQVPCLWDQWP
ncbi:MAG: hypothetical protein WD598_07670 [Acidimicrobiia bacterium]